MKKMKLFIILLFISNFTLLNAQSIFNNKNENSIPNEKVFVHITNNILLTGEKLYYSIYSLSLKENTPSNLSKTAYIELYNSDNKSIAKQKTNLKEGIGNSDLLIKTDLKTGSYKLLAYTTFTANKNIFFQEDIYIINPFEVLEEVTENIENISQIKEPTKNNYSIDFTDKQKYGKREIVTLSLKNILKEGNYSISINQKIDNYFPKKNTTVSFSEIEYTPKENNTFMIPEIRGSILHGKITPKTDNNLKLNNRNIGLTTVSENPSINTSVTNEKGEFYFLLPNLNTDKVSLQILDKERDLFNISLKENNDFKTNLKNFKSLKTDENLSKIISQKSLYTQVENAYNSTKKDSVFYLKTEHFLKNQKIKTYKLDDYKRFKTTKETIVEVIDNVYHIKKDDQYYVSIRSEETARYSYLPTLVLLDGYIVYDHNRFFEFNPYEIDKVSICRDKYIYGSEIYQGILIVNTFKNDYKPNPEYNREFSVLAPEPKKIYFNENYMVDKKERIPDYRTQLYWNSNLKNISRDIQFYTSDITGVYEIDIEGFTNKGEPISIKYNFNVE